MARDAAQPFRWALLGAGSVSRKFVLGLNALGGRARATVVASRNLETAERFARDLGVPTVARDYGEAAAFAKADAVYIATPPSEHEAHAMLAFAAGKPVLVEKPFALDAAAAERIVGAARAARVFCMEAMWTRFQPLIGEVKARLERGEIGAPRGFHGGFFGAVRPDPAASLFDPRRGGGALMHRGVYPLSLARLLLGPVVETRAMARLGATGVDEDCVLTLRHASGALSTVRASIRAGGVSDAVVEGEEGVLRIAAPIYRPVGAHLTKLRPRGAESGGGRFEKLRESGVAQGLQQRAGFLTRLLRGRGGVAITRPYGGNGYHYEAEAVMNGARDGALENPLMPLDESVEIMRVIDAARGQWSGESAE